MIDIYPIPGKSISKYPLRLGLLLLLVPCFSGVFTPVAQADLVTFNSAQHSENAAVRSAWLDALGIATTEFQVDFETGFVAGQNIHGLSIHPGSLILRDTGPGSPNLEIRTGSGTIGGSNVIGSFSVTQDEQAYLELDFSARPVHYVAFQDIDQSGTSGIVTFADGSSTLIELETTSSSGDSAEFFGLVDSERALIARVELNASGDGNWGLDNLEYGRLAVPEPNSLVGSFLILMASSCRRKRRRQI